MPAGPPRIIESSAQARRAWQLRIFSLTWVVYAGYYLCRKNFGVAIPLLETTGHFTNWQMANAVFAYSVMYAVCQFPIGPLADRYGARKTIACGLTLIVASNLAMAARVPPSMLILLAALNGAGQATGWSGLVRCMANWFTPTDRGVVMAWWGTNYALGGFFATVFATFVVTNSRFFPQWGWHRAFIFPSLLLLIVAAPFLLFVKESPDDLPGAPEPSAPTAPRDPIWQGLREVSRTPIVWTLSVSYFLLELTRYAFLFWLPLYLTAHLLYSLKDAGYLSSLFELIGFTGAIAAGYLSDRVFSSRRLPVCVLMLTGFGLTMFCQPLLAKSGLLGTAIGISLMGFFCYGPDTLLCGAAAQDAGGQKHAGAVVGFVDGFGHLGSILSPYIVIWVSQHLGWNRLFDILGFMAILSGVTLLPKWNFRSRELQT